MCSVRKVGENSVCEVLELPLRSRLQETSLKIAGAADVPRIAVRDQNRSTVDIAATIRSATSRLTKGHMRLHQSGRDIARQQYPSGEGRLMKGTDVG